MFEKQVYAIFLMKGWEREFRPQEIFYDLVEAKRFLAKLNENKSSNDLDAEWRIFRRSKTDWERFN